MRARHRTVIDVRRALARPARTISCAVTASVGRRLLQPQACRRGQPRCGQRAARDGRDLAGCYRARICQRRIIRGKEIAAAALASFPSGEEDPTLLPRLRWEGEVRLWRTADVVPPR